MTSTADSAVTMTKVRSRPGATAYYIALNERPISETLNKYLQRIESCANDCQMLSVLQRVSFGARHCTPNERLLMTSSAFTKSIKYINGVSLCHRPPISCGTALCSKCAALTTKDAVIRRQRFQRTRLLLRFLLEIDLFRTQETVDQQLDSSDSGDTATTGNERALNEFILENMFPSEINQVRDHCDYIFFVENEIQKLQYVVDGYRRHLADMSTDIKAILTQTAPLHSRDVTYR